ncbi:MAG TPA: autotransporter-associated beta strand repeat-containing protein [Roseimicrobium sp.]|nr:autotransporter-associated beta strand repeat-containing protein [Roseimicrobium sp.]
MITTPSALTLGCRRHTLSAFLTATLLLASQSTYAVNGTWLNTGATDGNWTTSSNWVGGTVPGATVAITGTNADASVAIFNTAVGTFGTSGSPVLIDSASENIKSITFDTAAGNYFIGTTAGNSLYLSSGGTIQITATLTNAINSVVTETINAPLVIEGANGTYSFTNNSANGTAAKAAVLNVGGQISGGNAGATVLTLNGSNTNANTVSGNIVNGSATSLGVTKAGAGTWTLSGNNSYTGATTVTAGTLILSGANTNTGATTITGGTLSVGTTGNLGGATSALIFDGGTLQITGTALTSVSGIGHTVTFNAGKTVGLDIAASGNTFTLDQALNATSALTKLGAGTLELTGANNYSGTTTVTTGTLKLSGTNNTAGLTSIGTATVQLNNSTANNGGLASGGITTNNSAINNLVSGLSLAATNTFLINGTTTFSGLGLTLNGAVTSSGVKQITNNASSLLTLAGNVYLSSDTTTTGRILTISGGGNTLISGVVANNSTGSGVAAGLTFGNTGTTTLSNTNTYTGVTTIGVVNAAIVSVSTIGDGGVAGNLGAAGNAASNLVFNGGSAVVSAASLLYTGATASTDRGFTINAGTFGGFNISNALTNLTVSGSAAATTGSLVKAGAGTLTLAGANSYTGSTTVNAGTLALTAAGAIGTGGGSAISLASGATLTESAANAITGSSSIALNTASTVFLSQANNFTGAISFGNGTSVLNLSDLNAIASASGITGSAGTINLLSNGAGTFNTLSTFSFGTGAGMTINVANNGSGSGNALQFGHNSSNVALATNRTLNITGANGYSLVLPKLTISGVGGTLNPTTAIVSLGTISNLNSSVSTASIGLGGTSTGNAVTDTISDGTGGAVTALSKSGTSSWKLSGANTYTGKTTVSGGTLQFAKTASLYNGATGSWTAANITAANGATLAVNVGGTGEFSSSDVNTLLSNISVTVSTITGLQAGSKIAFDTTNATGGIFTQGNVIANSTGTNGGAIGLTKLGAGTLVLDKVNTYTGTTTVSEGTLAVGANNAFGATAFNFNGGTFAVGTFTNTAVGTLSLTANSAITLGAGGTFAFADSHLLDWGSYALSISGTFVDGVSIRFGSDDSALTATQLGLISINGAGAALNSSGFLVSAVPEPSTYALLGGAGALLGACWHRRRNRRA